MNNKETYFEVFEYWKNDSFFDKSVRDELCNLDPINDQKEIEDRFYMELEFGTGGMRGIMGAGTNRINQYTIGKATKGLADYLISQYGDEAKKRGVAIAYDTRNNSEYYAKITASVLSSTGIKVYLLAHARPTPHLSFSVKYWGCVAGVVITASHNTKEYNGYKVYDENGCQMVPWQVEQVIKFIDAVSDYKAIDFQGDPGLVFMTDNTNEFIDEVFKQSRLQDLTAKNNLSIVYTPLHGTGNVPVTQILKKDGFTKLFHVCEQTINDGDFPTVISPNPEDRNALKLGISKAEELCADIVIGTDPDCDRIGVAVRDKDHYVLMTGNQIGALLMEFVIANTDLTKLRDPAVVKTVVTSELGARIAEAHHVSVYNTLTGFKFIGEKIAQLLEKNRDFLLGYEESYGYLVGAHARDKDAVVSAMLICEMAAFYKTKGHTLLEKMQSIYEDYGFYLDHLDSVMLKGKDGAEKIRNIMFELRNQGIPELSVQTTYDFRQSVTLDEEFGPLPTSNVLKFVLDDGSWIAVRPSGTEPKIKVYYSIRSQDEETAQNQLKMIQKIIQRKILI